ncbi:MAG: hypothetical protein PUJ93_05325, partial [Oscillospiraceae bacterium]|nr:hypothetical protein [Oscillospiraceae bacterium]MDY5735249.1 hypothetical protein [Oscillospiraceae bacterium]
PLPSRCAKSGRSLHRRRKIKAVPRRPEHSRSVRTSVEIPPDRAEKLSAQFVRRNDFSYFEQKQGENFVKITRQKTAFAVKNYISETKKRLPQHLVAVSFFAQKRNRTNVLKWEKMLRKMPRKA